MQPEVRTMNYRLQLSPIFGTRRPQQQLELDLPLRERWEGPAAKWVDAEVFRSWLVYDSDLEAGRSTGRLNWNMVLGLALAVAVSITFWVGVGLMVAIR
jgi:hypothetical protein